MTAQRRAAAGERTGPRRLPRDIWALGFGSLLMDTSSELVHSLLPVFLSTVLGASIVTIGVIEGMAEATASITKLFSGALSDRWRRRKPIVVSGYALAALTKPVFPLATSVGWVFGARFVDRVGKGIRGAPRDAMVADITPPPLRGAAYGLRQALDSVGAFLGPGLALLFMAILADRIRAVLWIATVPALLSVLVLLVAVHEPERKAGAQGGTAAVRFADARRLGARFWLVVVLGTVFTLARFSEAFLVLRARDVGLAIGLVPLVMIVMNVVYALAAYPAGAAADRMGARGLLLAGLAALILADLALARAHAAGLVLGGAALWGLHLALTQGLLSKLVADTAPGDLRGSAFGIFNLATGIALLFASVVAGELWQRIGPPATFLVGGGFAAVAMLGILAFPAGRRGAA